MSIEWLAKENVLIVGTLQLLATSLLIYAHKYWKNYRECDALAAKMDTIPRRNLSETSQNLLEAEGVAKTVTDKKMISPLSGRECIFWQIKIMAIEDNRVIKVIQAENPFLIQDLSASALVCHGKKTRFLFDHFRSQTISLDHPINAIQQKILAGASLALNEAENFYLIENVIEEGARIYLTGNITTIPGRMTSSISKKLASEDLYTLVDNLKEKGVDASIKGNHPPIKSVSGLKISSVDSVDDLIINYNSQDLVSKYVFGTKNMPLFISTITETMMMDDKPVVIYQISEKSTALLAASTFIFVGSVVKWFL